MKNEYYLGLDIGTDSVGYAVTDTTASYNLLKYKGEPMWGVHLFEAANGSAERRTYRTARRRLDRRQQRVLLIQEIFAKEISNIDPDFYKRIKESSLLRNETDGEFYCLFNDKDFSDKEYHEKYPTIHHLIMELITSDEPHDPRLVYLACSWLVAHRGHFLTEISEENIQDVLDLQAVYSDLISYFQSVCDEKFVLPWNEPDIKELEEALKAKAGVTEKKKKIERVLFGEGKFAPKKIENKEQFPFNPEGIVKLLAGSTYSLADLYGEEEYTELGSFSLGKNDEEYGLILGQLGENGDLLLALKAIYDWSILTDLLGGEEEYISQAKVKKYEEHKEDLSTLKYFIRKYRKEDYNEIFRNVSSTTNYVLYSKNLKSVNQSLPNKINKAKKEEFCKYILSKVKNINIEESDRKRFDDMIHRLELNTFMPKQVDGDNRVIPYQLYYAELKQILKSAESYLPFLKERDIDGYKNEEKILSIMKFRIPYYVGPLNNLNSNIAWIVKKANKPIRPWNFEEQVDLDKSEQAFIDRMTNKCTYLPGEDVMPKHSLLYEKFEVLNEINVIKIQGKPIPVELKQDIFQDLFLTHKKVTPKKIKDYLISNNKCSKEDAESLSGIDISIKSSLSSHLAFKNLMDSKVLSEEDVEKIIERATYSESKPRFNNWLKNEFPALKDEDAKYIVSLKFKDFGRLSRKFLCGIQGANKDTGEIFTVIDALWKTNDNLMKLLFENYTFGKEIDEKRQEYYAAHPIKLSDRLDEMYISNAVKRPIMRTLDIVKDIVKATETVPKKIFVEMARGAEEDQKNKRTKTRKQQILELYSKVKSEDVRLLKEELEKMGDMADNNLQGDKLFLYYMQLGKCMYTGKKIDINRLGDGTYNIEHIYPQSKVKDDSILNNEILVLSEENGQKSDNYPISQEIRQKMTGFWKMLNSNNLITDEKYKRLTRTTPFTDEEKWGFINRQLVETRQSTKAITMLLKERYPESEIVYVKAKLASEFRKRYELLKSRQLNDLHHAKDAYLNVVCGNVYNEKFTKKWFDENKEQYSINSKVLFGNQVKVNDKVIWNGGQSIESVKKVIKKNNIHLTKFAYCKKEGLFDQMPLRKSEGLIPLKRGLDTALYGGYNRAGVSFFIFTKYKAGKRNDIMLMPVELMYAENVLNDEYKAEEYAKDRIGRILGKNIEDVSFPLGLRKIKIGTVIELDGFRYTVAGGASGGKCVIFAPFMPLVLPYEFEQYVKALESFSEKCKKNSNLLFNSQHDRISKEKNSELYDILKDKYKSSIYGKRINPPAKTIMEGKQIFETLDEKNQTIALLNIVETFSRKSGGTDLTAIGGVRNAGATVSFSSMISNWNKYYKEAYIIDMSASGIWQKHSDNILDLI